jgi:PIN domain nuclease of toxin-antitoxin system
MRLLLDTNAFLWWRDGSSRLPARVRHEISDEANDIVVSIASLWEISIKRGLGKLRFAEDFEEVIADEEFELLSVTYAHLRALDGLPRHHGDPFDRLLIAQSIAENVPVVTSDKAFARYQAKTLW